MSFKKNFLAVLISTVFVLICSYLVKLPQYVVVYGMFIWISGSVVSLTFEDYLRKRKMEKEKLTWQYSVGISIVILGAGSFLWGAGADTNTELFVRLGLAVFFGFVGYFWFYHKYDKSINNAETREQKHFEKVFVRFQKAKTAEKKKKILSSSLRYRLTGDVVCNSLDFDHPLAFFEGECLTLAEAKMKPAGEDAPIADIIDRAERYINHLVPQEDKK